MNKKISFIIGIFALVITVGVIGFFGITSLAKGANSPAAWSGTWQMGPNLDTTILGCPAGNGLARYTGIYYPDQDRVYFLGGRCENNTTTTGAVFYFDPVTGDYTATGAVMTVPVSNYQIVQIDDDGYGHGPGFYIIGGRKGDGSQATEVQVYYPNDNTVGVIATDPFPPAVPYSPGGVVARGGMIYVFGGFDGVSMYANTYIYDQSAGDGNRWTLTACDLPTARSYISAVAVNDLIYAIGGDEYISSLTPITDTLVLDPADLGSCWQDDLMADLPQANGDAPAVYVDENYIGGGIFVVGGYWPAPGPYRWVFRYDVATDVWESFPDLVIPDPATGRRNQAAVYIPSTSGGTIDGVPGLWTFGGYDGSAANAMTESSEFFANPSSTILLLPDHLAWTGVPGTSVTDNFTLVNQSGLEDTYDLSFTSDVTWTVDLPGTIGPIPPGSQDSFAMTVDVPSSVDCGVIGSFTVTATSQADPGVFANATITVRAICAVTGKVTDANTGLGIVNAYVWVQTDPDGLVGTYLDGYTDANGNYLIEDVPPDLYYFAADALHYQPSFYPEGWPGGAITFTMGTEPVFMDVALVGSDINWDPTSISVKVVPSGTYNQTLTINNDGMGPYYFDISVLDGSQPEPPQAEAMPVPGLPRLDEQIFSDISTSPEGTTDFVVVLNGQADLSAAYGISDWNARGQAVYDKLTSYANSSQAGLRKYLNHMGVDYTPLYIINAVIIHSGDTSLVNNLAARQDVAQLVANRKIAVEDQPAGYWSAPLQTVDVPNTVEWNITQVKAPDVWAMGYTGQGVVVAEIDTGTQYDHPALVNQYRGNNGDGTFENNYNWYDPYFQCPDGGKTPCDGAQHGTHVMGTMVGDDGGANQIGMAPGAKWISCKGGDAVSGYLLTNQLLTCAQWILAPFDLNGENPQPDLRPNVVNNSWGGGPNDYWYTGAVSAWRAAGIFPAFANGNAGPSCSTAHSPGDYWQSFATGASDVNDMLGSFSSRGPALYTGFLKPQITSPGVNIRSSIPGGIYQGGWSGTSMASPHTAGAIALLLSAAPELVGQIDLDAWILEQTATPMTDPGSNCGGDYTNGPNNDWGYGRLNIYAAVTLATGGNLTPDWLSVDPQFGMIAPSESEAITLTFTAPVDTGTYTATLMLVGDDPYHSDVRIPVTMNVGVEKIYIPIIHK